MSKSSKQNFSMLGGAAGKKSKGGSGYSSIGSSKKVGAKVNSAAASSASPKEETPKSIGCHAGNVYEDSCTVARTFPGSIMGSPAAFGMAMCNSGVVPSWVMQNMYGLQYSAEGAPRGSERFGEGRGLMESMSFEYVKNEFPFQVLFSSNELSGRVYTQDGKRGLLSFPSKHTHVYNKPKKVYLSGKISNSFLRFADVNLQKIMGDSFREITSDAEGKEVIHYAVPFDNEIGMQFTQNIKKNPNKLSAGIGEKFAIQYHPVRPRHYRLTEAQHAEMLALISAAANSGRPVNMCGLDITIHPVKGTWEDPQDIEWPKGSSAYNTLMNRAYKAEFDLLCVYRLFGHPDMKLQK